MPMSLLFKRADHIICKSRADDEHKFSLLERNFVFFQESMPNPIRV